MNDPDPRLLCPITSEIMNNPVSTITGHTFDRESIIKWFSICKQQCKQSTDPLTNEKLTSEILIPNFTIREMIENKYPGHIKLSININNHLLGKRIRPERRRPLRLDSLGFRIDLKFIGESRLRSRDNTVLLKMCRERGISVWDIWVNCKQIYIKRLIIYKNSSTSG